MLRMLSGLNIWRAKTKIGQQRATDSYVVKGRRLHGFIKWRLWTENENLAEVVWFLGNPLPDASLVTFGGERPRLQILMNSGQAQTVAIPQPPSPILPSFSFHPRLFLCVSFFALHNQASLPLTIFTFYSLPFFSSGSVFGLAYLPLSYLLTWTCNPTHFNLLRNLL